MKKVYFITAIVLLSLTNCQKKDKESTETETDVTYVQDSDSLNTNTVENDSAKIDSSNVELLDDMSTKTKTKSTNPADGKFALSETKWKLVELDGKLVKNSSSKDYYINLDSKSGKFVAFAGCNKITGVYTMKDTDLLAFSKIMGTKMACPNSEMESNFIKSLGKVDNYTIEDNSLHLKRGKNVHLLKLEAVK